MVVVERYPELKSDQNFRDLQAQLEGTENRITVARNRYIQSVQDYNVTIRKFPVNLTAMVFGYDVKPNFTVENEAQIARPPTVDFGTPRDCASAGPRADAGPGARDQLSMQPAPAVTWCGRGVAAMVVNADPASSGTAAWLAGACCSCSSSGSRAVAVAPAHAAGASSRFLN